MRNENKNKHDRKLKTTSILPLQFLPISVSHPASSACRERASEYALAVASMWVRNEHDSLNTTIFQKQVGKR